MKKKLLLITCLLLVFIPHTGHTLEYSLDDLYRLALERSETIRIAEEDLYISKRQRDRARAVLFPTLSAFGSHTRFTGEKWLSSYLLQPDYNNQWGLRLDQSVSLSGREYTALQMTGKGIKRSRLDLVAIKEDYLYGLATSYYGLLKAKKALEIAGVNVERLTRHRDAAKARLRVGEVTKTALLRAEAELAGAHSDLIKTENSKRLASAVLAKMAGVGNGFDVKEPGFEKDLSIQKEEALDLLRGDCSLTMMDCLKERALSERAEIKATAILKEIAGDEVKYARGAYWPRLSLEGVYLRDENEPKGSLDQNERIYGVLKLEFPFFEGGLRVAEVQQAKARFRQAGQSLSDIGHSIEIEVEDAYLNLQTVSAILDQLKAEVAYALDNYNAVTKQFKYGLTDSIDIIDANTLLVSAERKLSNVQYDYRLAILGLQRATGTMLKRVTARLSLYTGSLSGERP